MQGIYFNKNLIKQKTSRVKNKKKSRIIIILNLRANHCIRKTILYDDSSLLKI